MEKLPKKTEEWLLGILKTDFQALKPEFSTQNNIHLITTKDGHHYLRIAPDLKDEHHALMKLKSSLKVPRVIGYKQIDASDHLLIEELPGENLCKYIGEWTNEAIVKKFAKAAREFHSAELKTVFSNNADSDFVLLHGDMSLPNMIFTESNFSGYIDLGKVSVGLRDDDLADAIWSLQRNIGPDYGELFLKEYGPIAMSPKIAKALAFRYKP